MCRAKETENFNAEVAGKPILSVTREIKSSEFPSVG